MEINLSIPGDPMGKQRPRFNRWTKSAHTPEKTLNYETYVKELYVSNRLPILNGYISVKIAAFYRIPESTSKKKRQQMLNNELLPDKKPEYVEADTFEEVTAAFLQSKGVKDPEELAKGLYSELMRITKGEAEA